VIKLFGVPAFAWAVLCLALAVVWVFVWPSGQAAGASGAAQRIALLALPAYAAFLYATVTAS
jgi:hypothetical protein